MTYSKIQKQGIDPQNYETHQRYPESLKNMEALTVPVNSQL